MNRTLTASERLLIRFLVLPANHSYGRIWLFLRKGELDDLPTLRRITRGMFPDLAHG